MKKKLSDIDQTEKLLQAHEDVCEVRYKNIEKRLDNGSAKFIRLENMIIGLYVLIIGANVLGQVI
jgi:hypothetical protein